MLFVALCYATGPLIANRKLDGVPPLHDGPWAAATLEVLLTMLRSAREGCEVTLTRQVAPRCIG